MTAIGAGTTYPDYKPAPFIVSSEVDGVDMVTVVTEGIFSYCGVKVKIDTDRYLGPETATVRAQGEAIGHVTTSGIRLADAVARRRASSHRRFEEGRPRHLRRADGPEQLQVGRTRHRRRRHRRRAGRTCTGRQRRARGTDAGRLRLGDHRHVRQAMARQGRRSRGRGRPHHRRSLRASGRQAARHRRYRHQDEGTALDTRPLFPGGGARHRLGRHADIRPALGLGSVRSEKGASRSDHADGFHDRRTCGLLSTRRGVEADRKADAARSPIVGRTDPGKLRAGAVHRAVHGGRGRIAARRCPPTIRFA